VKSNFGTAEIIASVESNVQGLGMIAFDSGRAEDEAWLSSAFERPPEFDLISGPRSAVILGSAGSGKSAIHDALVRISLTEDWKPQRLLVKWNPNPPSTDAQLDSGLVDRQLAQVLDACAWTLLQHVTHYLSDYDAAPKWARTFILWFIRTYLTGNFEFRTGRLRAELDAAGEKLVDQIAESPQSDLFGPDVAASTVLAELIKAIGELHLAGVWVLVDRLEGWSDMDPTRLSTGLSAFFSTLGLFEQAGFAYKIFLDSTMMPQLATVSGIVRRRIDLHYLHWNCLQLTNLLLKRIALAIGKPVASLDEICTDKSIPEWFERCGGMTPRGWLELARPLVAAYLERAYDGTAKPITREEWVEIRRRHPPLLLLNEETGQLWVGMREINDLPEGQLKLLAYLYRNAGQTCSRSELHYLADRGLSHIPHTHDDAWEPPKSYSGKLDTAIWRLRENIEPDPDDAPLYIQTEKGKGYRLENAH